MFEKGIELEVLSYIVYFYFSGKILTNSLYNTVSWNSQSSIIPPAFPVELAPGPCWQVLNFHVMQLIIIIIIWDMLIIVAMSWFKTEIL